VTIRRQLRVLGAPTGIAVVIVTFVITWGVLPKHTETVHDWSVYRLTYVGLDLFEEESLLGRRFTAIELRSPQSRYWWLKVDYAGPGYNHFVMRYADGTIQGEGECLVEGLTPHLDQVCTCRCYGPDGQLISEVTNGEGTLMYTIPPGLRVERVFLDGEIVQEYINGHAQIEPPTKSVIGSESRLE